MRFSMILEMVDRLSGPAKRARAGVGGLRETARALGQQMRRTAGDLQRGERSLGDVARSGRRFAALGLRRVFERAGAGARSLGRDLLSLERRLKLAERAGYATGRGLKKLGVGALGLLKNGLLAGGAAVAGAGSFALFDLFRTAGQFEQYQIQLEGLEGSAQAARKSMRWVQGFAQKTPYELDQVMEAFVSLKAYGIDPMNGSLEALGDASSGMSKPLMQAVEALADAATGEFERLKEFGIRASKAGNRVAFTFRKDGKDIRREADMTGASIEKALVGIFSDRFGGGMARQATTMFGMISNLKDQWSKFLLLIAEAGIFDVVKNDLRSLLVNVERMAANGELRASAEEISTRLKNAWEWGKKFVDETDWDAVKQDLNDIADAVMAVADAIIWLKGVLPKGGLFSGERRIIDGIKGLRGSLVPAAPGPAPGTPAARLPSDNGLVRSLRGKQASVSVGGRLEIGITAPPGYSARATSIAPASKAMPIEVRTGRTMRSAA